MKVVSAYPNNIQADIRPYLLISFDQRIDKKAAIPNIVCSFEQRKQTLKESVIEVSDPHLIPELKTLIPSSLDKTLVLVPQNPLPYATTITITVGPKIPSLEGPLLSTEPFVYSFHTISKFDVQEFIANEKELKIRFSQDLPSSIPSDQVKKF